MYKKGSVGVNEVVEVGEWGVLIRVLCPLARMRCEEKCEEKIVKRSVDNKGR